VLSITIFRALAGPRSREHIVQTTGSASDSVAAGVVFTIPAILLMDTTSTSAGSRCSRPRGLMGILMMIPLRAR